MNKGEGAIDEQFRFTTGEAFVNFLIDMAVDPDASESVSSRMTQLADKLAKRPATALELSYCEGVAERLGPIAGLSDDRARWQNELDGATGRAAELAEAWVRRETWPKLLSHTPRRHGPRRQTAGPWPSGPGPPHADRGQEFAAPQRPSSGSTMRLSTSPRS